MTKDKVTYTYAADIDLALQDPDDLAGIDLALKSMWDDFRCTPDTIYINSRDYVRMMRRFMSKRKWRRLRGKLKEQRRSYGEEVCE